MTKAARNSAASAVESLAEAARQVQTAANATRDQTAILSLTTLLADLERLRDRAARISRYLNAP